MLILGRKDYVHVLIFPLFYKMSAVLLFGQAVGTLLRTRKVLVIVDKKKACCPIKRVPFLRLIAILLHL